MPPGAGRKGGKLPKKKATSKHTHADENRIPIDTTSWPSSRSTTNDVVSPVVTQTRHSIPTSYDHFVDWQSPSTSATYSQNPWMQPPPPFPMWNWSNNQFSYPLSYMPPPLSSCELNSPENHDTRMFKICCKFGNVFVCNGCRNTFSETDKVVVQHKEFRQFMSPRTGLQQSKYGNAYYHARMNCIQLKFSHFQLSQVYLPENLKQKLSPSQKRSLYEEFLIIIE